MDVRAKLIEILNSSFEKQYEKRCLLTAPHTAEDLIANGVTVQEWISVNGRLPDAGVYVACIAKRNPFSRFMPMVARIEKNGWVNPMTEQYISEVTYWMPMPEPPKGE